MSDESGDDDDLDEVDQLPPPPHRSMPGPKAIADDLLVEDPGVDRWRSTRPESTF